MDETDFSISGKAKEYLTRKLEELQKKEKLIKMLYYSSITLSISISGVLTILPGFTGVPHYIIPILSAFTGILTGLSAAYNIHNKKLEINKTIGRLDYVVSCNGNFTEDEFKQMIAEISIL
jgi:hypothetical protein